MIEGYTMFCWNLLASCSQLERINEKGRDGWMDELGAGVGGLADDGIMVNRGIKGPAQSPRGFRASRSRGSLKRVG
jgi:hypothetical protein